MEYRVILAVEEDEDSFVPITGSEYETYKVVTASLRMLCHIEEAYDVVVGNYIELEEVIFGHSVRQLANRYPWGKWDYFDTARRSCHRALANLLSSARAFIDQSKGMVSAVAGPSDLDDLNRLYSAQYDSALAYRVMEALRNHTQHQGMSVTGVSFGARAYSTDPGDRRTIVQATPYVHLEELRRSPKFKKAVLAELERAVPHVPDPEEASFPVLPYVRQYVSGLSLVVSGLREQFSVREAEWAIFIRSEYERFWKKPPPKPVYGLSVEVRDQGRLIAEEWMSNAPLERIETMREVNGRLPHLTRQFVGQ